MNTDKDKKLIKSFFVFICVHLCSSVANSSARSDLDVAEGDGPVVALEHQRPGRRLFRIKLPAGRPLDLDVLVDQLAVEPLLDAQVGWVNVPGADDVRPDRAEGVKALAAKPLTVAELDRALAAVPSCVSKELTRPIRIREAISASAR